MGNNLYIPFHANLGKSKPNTLRNKEAKCPFCEQQTLRKEGKILKENGTQMLIENKFRTFLNAYQTVLIEHDTCEYDLSNYPKELLHKVMDFTIDTWLEMEKNPEFQSVVLIKNQGPASGGSIHHPHMQIVGFYETDAYEQIRPDDFTGVLVEKGEGFEFNISTKPKSEFYEFNLIIDEERDRTYLAERLQMLVRTILEELNPTYKSYNLAFYRIDGKIIVKVIMRFIVSVFLIGFNISQLPNNIEEMKTLFLRKIKNS